MWISFRIYLLRFFVKLLSVEVWKIVYNNFVQIHQINLMQKDYSVIVCKFSFFYNEKIITPTDFHQKKNHMKSMY